MNLTVSSLSANSFLLSPFVSRARSGVSSFDKLRCFRFFAPFYEASSGISCETRFQRSQFGQFLSAAIRVNGLQTYSKIHFGKTSEDNFSMSECQFLECKSAPDSLGGGAISLDSVAAVSIKGSSFVLCSAIYSMQSGGSLFASGRTKTMRLENNCFSRCSASLSGSSFYINSQNADFSSNFTSVNTCPYFLKKKQQNGVFLHSRIDNSNFNISHCHSLASPAFSFNSTEASKNSFFSINNQTGSRNFIIFDFSSSESESKSFFSFWNLIFEEPKNKMVFRVLKHGLNRCVFLGGEFDYALDVLEGDLTFNSIRSDKRFKIGKQDEKNPTLMESFVFDKDAIKLNEVSAVSENNCKIVFRVVEEKVHISPTYLIMPFLVIGQGIGVAALIAFMVKYFKKEPIRDDEEALGPPRLPKAIN